jgi:hypothetical protein
MPTKKRKTTTKKQTVDKRLVRLCKERDELKRLVKALEKRLKAKTKKTEVKKTTTAKKKTTAKPKTTVKRKTSAARKTSVKRKTTARKTAVKRKTTPRKT